MTDKIRRVFNFLKKIHVQQQDEQDCGAACLSMILKAKGVKASLESVREKSGTTATGTSLLGLQDGAEAFGLQATGYQAELKDLYKLTSPAILHVENEFSLYHYVVLFHQSGNRFLICDPAKDQPEILEASEISQIWRSGKLLLLDDSIDIEQKRQKEKPLSFKIMSILRQNSGFFYTIITLGIITSLLQLTTAFYTQQLVDHLLPKRDFSQIIISLCSWLFLLFFLALLTILRQYLLAEQSQKISTSLINHFLGKLLLMPKTFFDSKKTGDLVTRLNDTEKIEDIIRQVVSNTMIEGVSILIGLVVLTFYHPLIALILVLNFVGFTIYLSVFKRSIRQMQRSVLLHFAQTESTFIDQIKFVEAIKIANKESEFQEKMIHHYSQYQQVFKELEKLSARFNFGLESLTLISLGCIIINSVVFFLADMLSTGELIAILPISLLVMSSSAKLILVSIDYQGAKIAFDRVEEFAEHKTETRDIAYDTVATADLAKIIIRNFSFRFPGKLDLLASINCEFETGKWYSLFGESGSGKSTFLQVLQKFYPYTKGSIEVGGAELSAITPSEWRSRVASVPQTIELQQGSLIENICMSEHTDENEQEVIAFCQSYKLDQYFTSYPNGYQTILGDGGISISGGQQQLVALARALYQQPDLLLLDEATSAMDRKMEQFALDLIRSLKDEMIIISVTHRPLPVKYSDYVYIIDREVKAEGTPEILREGENLYAALLADLV